MQLFIKNMCGIYRIINIINGKCYVGKSIDIEFRWKQHLRDIDDNCLIHRAMKKYGIENFILEIVEECNGDMLNNREKYWIKYYDCCILDGDNKGYNMTRGGDGLSRYDYKLIYDLWDTGHSTAQIKEITGIDKRQLYKILNSHDAYSSSESYTRNVGIKVSKFDLDGNFICTYSSILSAAQDHNIDLRNFQIILKHGYNSNFQFKIGDDTNNISPLKLSKYTTGRMVGQYSLDGELINVFSSIREATRAMGLKSDCCIGKCLRGEGKTAAGFIWKYYDEINELKGE